MDIMQIDYSKSCTEVLTIINNMSIENQKKIPKELIDAFEENKDINYNFYLDYSKDLKSQNISEFTKAILKNLYRDYWVTEEKRKIINLKEQQERNELEKLKREKYNPDNIFKKDEPVLAAKNTNLPVEVKEEKQSFLAKIISKIKGLFK